MKHVVGLSAFLILSTSVILPYLAIPSVAGGIRVNQRLMLGVLVLAGCGVYLVRSCLPAALLIFYAALRIFFADAVTVGGPLYLMILAALMFCVGMNFFSYANWEHYRPMIYDTICAIAVLNVAYAIPQWFGYWPHVMRFMDPRVPAIVPAVAGLPHGLMSNPDELRCLLAMSVPFFCRSGRWHLLAVVALGFYLAGPALGLIVIIALGAVYAWKRLGFWKGAATGAIPLAALILYGLRSGYSFNLHLGSRIDAWIPTLKAVLTKPFFGHGPGAFMFTMTLPIGKTRASEHMLEVHNDWLEALFSLGIVGFALMGWLTYRTIRIGLAQDDARPVYSFMASCILAFAFFTWQLVPLIVLTILSMAMIWGDRA